jgi:hypothetical protein
MVSSDVVSLFIRVPIREALDLLSRHIDENILGFFRHVLNSSSCFGGELYDQIIWVVIGSPLSQVIAPSYMEEF